MKKYNYYVYIMASKSGTLYVGVTNNIIRRTYEHKNNLINGFTKRYSCHRLVYFENYYDIYDAISREKQMKKWRREKKQALIKKINPIWKDLYENGTIVMPTEVEASLKNKRIRDFSTALEMTKRQRILLNL